MKQAITLIFLALLVTGCGGVLEPDGGAGGNVTITIETAGRTVRPDDITASIFSRIAVEFTKDGYIQTLTLTKPQTSGTINLERGTWSINALGFIDIDGREYEAARGSSSVTVNGSASVSISLQTGIFSGSPGVFSYNVDYPANVTEAVLAITPLDDLYGYPTTNTGNTVNLTQGKTGSFELLPGYYMLNLTARVGASMMAVWNELVHIYSGRETAASHTFNAADFTGVVALSGSVAGGELEGNHITEAVVTVYADAYYINRIASVHIPHFNKMTTSPFYYTGSWSMTVPSSLTGRNVYFQIEETLNGPAGTRTHTYNDSTSFEVSENDNAGIELGASFYWWKYVENGNDNAVTCTVGADGTVTITTTETVENEWDNWRQGVGINYPAENDLRYVYEFEAWTDSGKRPLSVEYIERHVSRTYLKKEFTIDTTRRSFVILSDTRIDPYVSRNLEFQIGNQEITGTFHIKIKSIKIADEYVPPNYDNQPRFTATATNTGIHLKADFRGLPMGIGGVIFSNETVVGNNFQSFWYDHDLCPETYEIIYPYVEPGKDYVFKLHWQGDTVMASPTAEVRATHGRGEFKFSNESELALLLNGNMLGFNKAPDITAFINANGAKMVDPRYRYCVVSGASWSDPAAIWRYETNRSEPESVDLTDLQNIPYWVDISGFMGKTCFAEGAFSFDYDDNDIYPVPGTHKGAFYTLSVTTPPFIYPNTITGALTATPHTEGVKLIVDLDKISYWTEGMTFHLEDWSGARLWIDADSWKEYGGEFYGQNTVEIVYPFVTSGKTYTFEVEFEGTGTVGQATITPTAGLGEMVVSNQGNVGLLYNRNTKTMTYSTAPTEPAIAASPNITRKYWQWEFYKGINWDMQEWTGTMDRDSPITSVTFNETFDPVLGSRLSESPAFVAAYYRIVYNGYDFYAEASSTSLSFTFPYFGKAGYGDTYIRTAFDIDRYMYLEYYDNIHPGDELFTRIGYNGDIPDFISVSFAWYIDGVLKAGHTNYEERFPTSGLDPGMYYGLVVVTIDETAFAREFAFRVGN